MQIRRSYLVASLIIGAAVPASSAISQEQDTCILIQKFINLTLMPTRNRLSWYVSGNKIEEDLSSEEKKSVCSDAELLRSQAEIALQRVKFLNASRRKDAVCLGLQPQASGKLEEALKLKEAFNCDQ